MITYVEDPIAVMKAWTIGGSKVTDLTHFDVVDAHGRTIGVVARVWPIGPGRGVRSIGVRLNWVQYGLWVIPGTSMRVDEARAAVHVPYTVQQIQQVAGYLATDQQ